MSYLNKINWDIIPDHYPVVRKSCSKCKEKTEFINSGKFRVNANSRKLDVWLIYQCEKCKTTWNLSLYERIDPNSIDKTEYEGFLSNEEELAAKYGFDSGIFTRNKASASFDLVSFHVDVSDPGVSALESPTEVTISMKYPLPIRADKLIADQLMLSRNQVRKLCEEGKIVSMDNQDLLKDKVNHGMRILIQKI